MNSYLRRQVFPDVLPGSHQSCTLLYQGIRPPGRFAGYVTRYSIHVAILLKGAAGGYAGSAGLTRFNDEDADAHAADDAIALGKILRSRKGAHGIFRDDGSAAQQYLFGEVLIFFWIDDVDAGSPHGDSRGLGSERAFVRSRVNAAGHAAQNDELAQGKIAGKHLRHARAIGRGVTSADDGERGPREKGAVPANPQHCGGIVDFAQAVWIFLVSISQQRTAVVVDAFPFFFRGIARFAFGNEFDSLDAGIANDSSSVSAS